jgi:hypothetical protein
MNGATPIPFSSNLGTVEVVVPELGTLVLFLAGGGALGLARRRRGEEDVSCKKHIPT